MSPRIGEELIYAFTQAEQGGNPSYVVATEGPALDEGSAYAELAARISCEVTHLHFDTVAEKTQMRFYVSSGPIAFCGHGALAAAAWMAKHGRVKDGQVQLHHGAGSLLLLVQDGGQRVSYEECAGDVRPLALKENFSELQAALSLGQLREDECQLFVGGAQRPKLLVRLPGSSALASLQVDPSARDSICASLGVTGLYLYVPVNGASIKARHFPKGSSLEDLATGNMAPTIARHLARSHLVIEQGGVDAAAARLDVASRPGGRWMVSGSCRFA